MKDDWKVVIGITKMLEGLAIAENVQFAGSREEEYPVDGQTWYATLGGKNIKIEVTIIGEGKK
jgi:hypothetical protein